MEAVSPSCSDIPRAFPYLQQPPHAACPLSFPASVGTSGDESVPLRNFGVLINQEEEKDPGGGNTTLMAPEKEAYFNMFDPGDDNALLRDENSRFRDKDRKSRLSLLLSKSGSHENVSPEKKATTTVNSTSPATALRWSDSFEELLNDSDGVKTFTQFLRTEFSEENIEFWLACEDYKTTESNTKLPSKAKQIYAVYIENDSPKEINIDHSTRVAIQKIIAKPTTTCFDVAQGTIYALMKKDCYPRFLKSDIYLSLTRRKAPGAMTRRRSRSFVFNDRGEPAFGSDSRL